MTSARDGGFPDAAKTLPQILGLDKEQDGSHTGDGASRTLQSGGKPQVSILTASRLSVKEVKTAVSTLRETKPELGPQDTARPFQSDILERVGEEDMPSEDSVKASFKGDVITEEVDGTHTITALETEENVVRRKVHEAVRKDIVEKFHLGDIGLLDHEAKKNLNFINILFFIVIVALVVISLGVL